jgi:hypothetical protein
MAVALLSYRYSLFTPDHRVLVQDLLSSVLPFPKRPGGAGGPLPWGNAFLFGRRGGGGGAGPCERRAAGRFRSRAFSFRHRWARQD